MRLVSLVGLGVAALLVGSVACGVSGGLCCLQALIHATMASATCARSRGARGRGISWGGRQRLIFTGLAGRAIFTSVSPHDKVAAHLFKVGVQVLEARTHLVRQLQVQLAHVGGVLAARGVTTTRGAGMRQRAGRGSHQKTRRARRAHRGAALPPPVPSRLRSLPCHVAATRPSHHVSLPGINA